MSPPARPVSIAVLLADIDTAFSMRIASGVVDAVRAQGARAVFVPGHYPAPPSAFDLQFNLVFRIPDQTAFDGILAVGNSLLYHLTPEALRAFFASLPKLPIQSLGFSTPEVPSAVIDNYSGFRHLLQHLIEEHSCRRLALIAGPQGHEEANQRLQAWHQTCEEAGLAHGPELLRFGAFTQPSGREAMAQLLQSGVSFDAVVAANDEMALGAMSLAVERGIRVPEQVLFAGFDDILAAGRMGVALTTVNQPLYGLGKMAAERLLAQIQGVPIEHEARVPTRLVRRQSCGCAGAGRLRLDASRSVDEPRIAMLAELAVAPELQSSYLSAIQTIENGLEAALSAKDFRPFLEAVHALGREALRSEGNVFGMQALLVSAQNWLLETRAPQSLNWPAVSRWLQQAQIALSGLQDLSRHDRYRKQNEQATALRNLLKSRIATFDLERLLQNLSEALQGLGVRSCFISLYSGEGHINSLDDFALPRLAQLMYAYIDGVEHTELHSEVFETAAILPQAAWGLAPLEQALAIFPIFHGLDHFGLIVFGFEPNIDGPWESIRDEVSSALKASLLVSELAATRDALRRDLDQAHEGQRQLAHIAHRDELTGVLNRRGFLIEASARMARLRASGKGAAVLFADLDGLKPINDHFGHAAGDDAIRRAADVLRHGFRAHDIIGRLGGDEFAVLTSSDEAQTLDLILQRLRKSFTQQGQDLPYHFGCSLGYVIASADSSQQLEDLLAEADALLYEEKRRRKTQH